MWVKLPAFYASADTVIYMYYGDSNAVVGYAQDFPNAEDRILTEQRIMH